MVLSLSAASATVGVGGPRGTVWSQAATGDCGTRPYVGFSPKTPLKCAGMRIEPAPSLPWCNGP